jgi:hypothetical protein
MKNLYKFNFLVKSEVPSGLSEPDVFFKMRDLMCKGELKLILDDAEGVIECLMDEYYYVAHNLVAFKGKKPIFLGRVFMAEKSDLVSFIRFSMESGDLRSMLLSPCFDREPSQVILVTEDASCLYAL